MKYSYQFVGVSLLMALTVNATAALHYVYPTSTNAVPPYTSWATAASRIQDAVTWAAAGDEVVVADGLYATGGTGYCRVTVNKPITVRSVSGPANTIICGAKAAGGGNGSGAVQCVYLTNGAVLCGFTLTNGATISSGRGGGAWCVSSDVVVSNCVLVGNSAYQGGGAYGGTLKNCRLIGNSADQAGGGAYSSTLDNCTVIGNSARYDGGGVAWGTLSNSTLTNNWSVTNSGGGAFYCTLNDCALSGNASRQGGGAYGGTLNGCAVWGNTAKSQGGGAGYSTLNNCTLTGNSAGWGGGTFNCALTNSIVYFNVATLGGANYELGSLSHCCTTPLSTDTAGSFGSDPQLASASHLSAGSPCRGAGNAVMASSTDIDGETWLDSPSIGCDEYHVGAATGPLAVGIGCTDFGVAVGFEVFFTGHIDGRTICSAWDFGDGVTVSNRPYTRHTWSVPGDYPVVLTAWNDSYSTGVSATVTIHVEPVPVHYVVAGSTNPIPPYLSWETAAGDIQQAVDAASMPGGLLLVSDGTYDAGGRVIYGAMTNRVVVDKPVTLRSVNGPGKTIIQGYQVPGITNGDSAVRCVYLASGATLSGFTLTNGGTRMWGDYVAERSGGGVLCESASATLSNCVLAGNSATFLGGGAYFGTLNNCTLTGNSTTNYGGATYFCELNNCVLAGNTAFNGGGAYGGSLHNCTVTGNSAPWGGGTYSASMLNCIVYFNNATVSATNYYFPGDLSFCCTVPLPSNGEGNFTNAPSFVDPVGGDLRLQPDSPCINAGNNSFLPGPTDLDGNPRVAGGTVDIGAYEFQRPTSLISYAWLEFYGLSLDGSADSTDPDGDGMNNWQEWIARTDPTNGLSLLKILSASTSSLGTAVQWQSVSGLTYYLQRSPNLTMQPAFSSIQSNIIGLPGSTIWTDTNALGTGAAFYRVGVQ